MLNTMSYQATGVPTILSASVLTGMVPAASSGASSPPPAFKRDCAPETSGVLAESVWGQVTDLQPRELTQKLLERHPDTDTHSLLPAPFKWIACR